MLGMTARQEDILNFITSEITRQGYPPTMREIGTRFGIRSTNGVQDHLRALERKGYIAREDLKSRGIRLLDKPRPGQPAPTPAPAATSAQPGTMAEVTVYRRIVPGPEPFLGSNVAGTIRVGVSMVPAGPCFGLRLAGDSMADAGFRAGDDLIFARRSHVELGQLVCVLLGDEAVVRYVYPEKEYIRLQPANAKAPPVLLRSSDWSPSFVVGVATGMLRRYGPPPA